MAPCTTGFSFSFYNIILISFLVRNAKQIGFYRGNCHIGMIEFIFIEVCYLISNYLQICQIFQLIIKVFWIIFNIFLIAVKYVDNVKVKNLLWIQSAPINLKRPSSEKKNKCKFDSKIEI